MYASACELRLEGKLLPVRRSSLMSISTLRRQPEQWSCPTRSRARASSKVEKGSSNSIAARYGRGRAGVPRRSCMPPWATRAADSTVPATARSPIDILWGRAILRSPPHHSALLLLRAGTAGDLKQDPVHGEYEHDAEALVVLPLQSRLRPTLRAFIVLVLDRSLASRQLASRSSSSSPWGHRQHQAVRSGHSSFGKRRAFRPSTGRVARRRSPSRSARPSPIALGYKRLGDTRARSALRVSVVRLRASAPGVAGPVAIPSLSRFAAQTPVRRLRLVGVRPRFAWPVTVKASPWASAR